MDLFVGGRVLTGKYPLSPRSYILENNNGYFTDVTKHLSTKLLTPGMVTDAAWADLNNDNQAELIIAGEWMPIRIFKNSKGETLTKSPRMLVYKKQAGGGMLECDY